MPWPTPTRHGATKSASSAPDKSPMIGMLRSRHAHAAIANGPDDATALALAGFVMALVAHDMPTARKAFDQALTISPSSFLALAFGGAAVGWKGDAERAIDWGERAIRISPFDRRSICPITRSQSAIFCWDATTRPQRRRGRRSTRSRSSASRMSSWRPHLLPQGTWTRRGPPLHVLWRCNLLQYARILLRDRDAALSRHTIF